METTWDKLRAVLFALGVHAFAIGLLFTGLHCQRAPAMADAEGPVIEAMLVSTPQESVVAAKEIKAAERKLAQQSQQDATPPPQPKPEPKPIDAPKPQQLAPQVQLPKPDTVDQQEVRRLAEQVAEQKKLQEQDERRKQEQVDLTNKQQQQQEAENRQRLAQQELEHQQQVQVIRKQLADAKRNTLLQEQKLKQIEDQRTRLAQNAAPVAATAPIAAVHPPAGNNGAVVGLKEKYLEAIRSVVRQNWHPVSVPERVHCHVTFKQLPGGEVFGDVTFGDCPFDATARASVEDALKRTPLPYAGFEPVFQREGTIDMCNPDEACTK
jgi:colicin import membrane protein